MASGNLLYDSGAQPSAPGQPGEVGWVGGWREGTYVFLWLIHDDVWQKSIQYCKAVYPSIKNKLIFKKKEKNLY